MGGIAGSFFDKLVRPAVRAAVAEAKRNQESEWDVRQEHQRTVDGWAVRIARGNARLIRAAQLRERLPPSHSSPPL